MANQILVDLECQGEFVSLEWIVPDKLDLAKVFGLGPIASPYHKPNLFALSMWHPYCLSLNKSHFRYKNTEFETH